MKGSLAALIVLPVWTLLNGAVPSPQSPWGIYSPSAFECSSSGCSEGCSLAGGGQGHKTLHGSTALGIAHACEGGFICDTAHCYCNLPGCGEENEETALSSMRQRNGVLVALLERAAAGDTEAAVALFSRYPESVSYNAERGSLQLKGCRDDMAVANVPLSSEQVKAILED